MKKYDLVEIGAGPANLSLAALACKADLNAIFVDAQKEFSWHPGMLLSEAKLQVSFLKDLVTLVDPTNPYSFLNFLTEEGCLYQFVTANFSQISRLTFNQYLKWAFNKIPTIRKNQEVTDVKFNGDFFSIKTLDQEYQSKKIVLGSGLKPYIPECCKNIIGDDVYHNAYFLNKSDDYHGKKIAIIGGGQSGAEIVCSLLSNRDKLPASITWLSKRLNFLPIDDSPFTNELFTPKYTKYFYQKNTEKKKSLLMNHKLASDGISQYTAAEIYRKLYELRFMEKKGEELSLLPSHELLAIEKTAKEYKLTILDAENEATKLMFFDKVILCTGYNYQEPLFLTNIKNMLHYGEHGLVVNSNYEVSWDGMHECSIYIQNGARHTHGVADPNLSLLAYRSATILNHVMGYHIYPNINGSCLVNWMDGE